MLNSKKTKMGVRKFMIVRHTLINNKPKFQFSHTYTLDLTTDNNFYECIGAVH